MLSTATLANAHPALGIAERLGLIRPEDLLDLGARVATLAGRNRTTAVHLGDGRGFVIKEPRGPVGRRTVDREAMALELLSRIPGLDGLPAPLGSDAATGALACAVLPGAPLADADLGGPDGVLTMGALGRLLGVLHAGTAAVDIGEAPRPAALDLLLPSPLLLRATGPGGRRVIAHVQADAALADALRLAASRWAADAFVHGDVSDGNVLLHDRAPLLVDWEFSGRGDPAWDLGCGMAIPVARWAASLAPHEWGRLPPPGPDPRDGPGPAVDALISAYLSAAVHRDADRTGIASRGRLMCAVRLVQLAFERGAVLERPDRVAMAWLATATGLACRPEMRT